MTRCLSNLSLVSRWWLSSFRLRFIARVPHFWHDKFTMTGLCDGVERRETGLSHWYCVAAKKILLWANDRWFSLGWATHFCGVTVSASLPVKVDLNLSVLFLFKSKPRSTLFLIPGWHSPTTSLAAFHIDSRFLCGFCPLLFCLAPKLLMLPLVCLSPLLNCDISW